MLKLKNFAVVFICGLSFVALTSCGSGGGSSSSGSSSTSSTSGGSTTSGGSSSSGGTGGSKVSCTSPAPDHSCVEYTFSGSNSSFSGTGAIYFYETITSATDGAAVCGFLNSTTTNSGGTESNISSPCEAGQTQGTGCASAGSIGYCSFDITGNSTSSTISNSTWHNL
ncbi:MAG: hypothetical protein HQK86_09385 [Nitrospinae bacterium]|nr:hypothetical protein [Nitrospinota bacterium]